MNSTVIRVTQSKTGLFLLVVLLLSPIILFWPGWILDDSGFMLNSLKNNPFPFLNMSGGDRFFPLTWVGHGFVSFLSFSPVVFFIYNFLLALASV